MFQVWHFASKSTLANKYIEEVFKNMVPTNQIYPKTSVDSKALTFYLRKEAMVHNLLFTSSTELKSHSPLKLEIATQETLE